MRSILYKVKHLLTKRRYIGRPPIKSPGFYMPLDIPPSGDSTLHAVEAERQYTWDLINEVRYGRKTLQQARDETLQRLSEVQVEADIARERKN